MSQNFQTWCPLILPARCCMIFSPWCIFDVTFKWPLLGFLGIGDYFAWQIKGLFVLFLFRISFKSAYVNLLNTKLCSIVFCFIGNHCHLQRPRYQILFPPLCISRKVSTRRINLQNKSGSNVTFLNIFGFWILNIRIIYYIIHIWIW